MYLHCRLVEYGAVSVMEGFSNSYLQEGHKKVTWTQSCPTLSDPTDCSPPGSSVCRIVQARILEWVVISSPGGSSQPKDQTESPAPQADSLSYEPTEKPRLLDSALPQTLHLLKKKKNVRKVQKKQGLPGCDYIDIALPLSLRLRLISWVVWNDFISMN